MKLNKKTSQNIENIAIFICDSLRFDYTPKSIFDMGYSLKTIASSLYTASSFPSMISGLYPPKTGVHSWDDLLPRNLRGLLELDGYNTSLWCETTWTDLPPDKSAIHKILGNPRGISLKDIEPPFIYIEDDKGGHCPYGLKFGEFMGGGCPDFYKEYGKKGIEELKKQYRKGIEISIDQFKNRLKTLNERGLTDNTLIVFTSDHGELLGEYGGLTGHGRPPCPELVYVPTVFIHKSLNQKDNDKNSIMRHVDLYPTISSLLNKKLYYETDGIDLNKNPQPSYGLNFRFGAYHKIKNKLKKIFTYKSSSIWDSNGGYIFHGLGRIRATTLFSYKLFIQRHPEFNFMIENSKSNISLKYKNSKKLIKHLTSSQIKYQKPNMSKKEAEEIIKNYLVESKDFNEKDKIRRTVLRFKNLKNNN